MAKFLSCGHNKWNIFLLGVLWCRIIVLFAWGIIGCIEELELSLSIIQNYLPEWFSADTFGPKVPRETINKTGQSVFVSFVSGLWHQCHMEHTSVTRADCILWHHRNILPRPKIKHFIWLYKRSCVQNGTCVELLYYILLKKTKKTKTKLWYFLVSQYILHHMLWCCGRRFFCTLKGVYSKSVKMKSVIKSIMHDCRSWG